ncbi:MAG: DUF4827 family protein [Tannerellaceae bacterium]
MRKILSVLKVVLYMLFLVSCDKSDIVTFDDLIREDKLFLEQYMKENQFVVLNEFPADGIFQENEYVLLNNGVYLHVVDYGDSKNTAVGTKVSTVAKGKFLTLKDGSEKSFNGFEPETDWMEWPINFEYKERRFPTESFYVDEYIVNEGYMSVLKYVGNNSTVKMIIPLALGTNFQINNQTSVSFDKVTFSYIE